MLSGLFISLALVLQFDAAWHSERRIGACGCAIYVQDGCSTPVAFGARYVPRSLGCTSSGAAEYDALLFGLAYVASHAKRLSTVDSAGGASVDKHHICLSVQGDCRTVIDQMRGIASPNILKDRYTAATSLVKSLNETLLADEITLAVEYKLLSRDDNRAADAIAGAAIEWVQGSILQQFEVLLQSSSLHEARELIDSLDLPTAAAPALLVRLAESARVAGNSGVMRQAAQALAERAKAYKTMRPLAATSVRLEVEALRLGGDIRGSEALEHQRRFLLAKEDASAVAACIAASENAMRVPPSTSGPWFTALRAWRDTVGEHGEDKGALATLNCPGGLWVEP